ncbi:MAG: hypothetical protein MZU84_03875 [Sphingobacterium sp.]|nr:hypothetical protein [Sphingobacterium sp.]
MTRKNLLPYLSHLDGKLKQDYQATNIPVYIQDFIIDKINRNNSNEISKSSIKKVKKIIKNAQEKERLAIRCAGSITKRLLQELDFSKS